MQIRVCDVDRVPIEDGRWFQLNVFNRNFDICADHAKILERSLQGTGWHSTVEEPKKEVANVEV